MSESKALHIKPGTPICLSFLLEAGSNRFSGAIQEKQKSENHLCQFCTCKSPKCHSKLYCLGLLAYMQHLASLKTELWYMFVCITLFSKKCVLSLLVLVFATHVQTQSVQLVTDICTFIRLYIHTISSRICR